ncbi:hypothetical protein AYO21_11465 [Fonsecaea monophora]|uniref:Uncharacterized protein n=1 Tax=Fonsecaea monophora TaxID=254056 RepID=A0A177ETR6_9EURO|nr:hypothetical protein AYO21_11465 [Fonsecaea monophora]OAG34379.1 hypothetical protein AYO21_11465 [Fonsecaea monophora]
MSNLLHNESMADESSDIEGSAYPSKKIKTEHDTDDMATDEVESGHRLSDLQTLFSKGKGGRKVGSGAGQKRKQPSQYSQNKSTEYQQMTLEERTIAESLVAVELNETRTQSGYSREFIRAKLAAEKAILEEKSGRQADFLVAHSKLAHEKPEHELFWDDTDGEDEDQAPIDSVKRGMIDEIKDDTTSIQQAIKMAYLDVHSWDFDTPERLKGTQAPLDMASAAEAAENRRSHDPSKMSRSYQMWIMFKDGCEQNLADLANKTRL